MIKIREYDQGKIVSCRLGGGRCGLLTGRGSKSSRLNNTKIQFKGAG